MSEILNITRGVSYDNSISKLEYHTYMPFIESFGVRHEVRIAIQQQDLLILPSKSFLYIEGEITKADGTIVKTAKLGSNAFMHLFDDIRYELNGVEIDYNKNVGITSTLKNYISLNQNESDMLQNASWSPKQSISAVNGSFNFCYPLKNIFGFAEDCKQIIVN